MKILRITLEMDLTNSACDPLSESALKDVGDITEEAIRNRLFGEGFLPDEVEVHSWTAKSEIIS